MPRDKLSPRRESVTCRVVHHLASGKEWHLVVTYGIEHNRVLEAFCASFKSGYDMEVLAVDASILLSRLLQYGDTLEAIVKTLGEPPSIIKSIAAAGLQIEKDLAPPCPPPPEPSEPISDPPQSPSSGSPSTTASNSPATSKSGQTDSATTPPNAPT